MAHNYVCLSEPGSSPGAEVKGDGLKHLQPKRGSHPDPIPIVTKAFCINRLVQTRDMVHGRVAFSLKQLPPLGPGLQMGGIERDVSPKGLNYES